MNTKEILETFLLGIRKLDEITELLLEKKKEHPNVKKGEKVEVSAEFIAQITGLMRDYDLITQRLKKEFPEVEASLVNFSDMIEQLKEVGVDYQPLAEEARA